MITLLQHTHLSLPHYDDKEWDWLRGALCTVDRSYGRFLNVMHHHIADTHVAHHLFSQVRLPCKSCSWTVGTGSQACCNPVAYVMVTS